MTSSRAVLVWIRSALLKWISRFSLFTLLWYTHSRVVSKHENWVSSGMKLSQQMCLGNMPQALQLTARQSAQPAPGLRCIWRLMLVQCRCLAPASTVSSSHLHQPTCSFKHSHSGCRKLICLLLCMHWTCPEGFLINSSLGCSCTLC